MRAALLGTGRIGALHVQTLMQDPDVTEVVVADADAARARATAQRLGASLARPDELWDGRVDAVVIAAATTAHADLLHRGADAGLPMFCEKPLASDVAGTRAVLEHVRAAGISLQVGFQRRFDAGYRSLRAAVESGALGVLHLVRACSADAEPPPPAYIPVSGGIFRDALIHDFDIIRFVTGREVSSVWATGANRGADYIRDAGDADTAAATLELDDGTLATVTGCRHNGAGYDVRMEAVGSRGTMAVGLDARTPLRSAEPGVTWPDGEPYATFGERFRAAYATELRDWVRHVLGRIPNPCPPDDALEALYVAEAAQLSLDEGRPVGLAEVRSAAALGLASTAFPDRPDPLGAAREDVP